jgi:cell division protein ZapD
MHPPVITLRIKKGFSTAGQCFTIRRMSSSDNSRHAAATGPVYEQPLNERMRTFLRLDFLYQQALYHEEREDQWSTRAAMSALLEILAITARGDVRSEVLKELERQVAIMQDYTTRPGVDTSRLKAVLSNLMRLRTELNSVGALFMQRLRDSEFLNSIKHRSTIPGGTCEFDLPDYRHWLDQPFAARSKAFNEWMVTIRPLCDAVTELLWLTREAGRARPESATAGTFQIAFERENPCQLLRIALPAGTPLFPEISGSHHRCSIRFLTWNDLHARPVQTTEDVKFQLTVCT